MRSWIFINFFKMRSWTQPYFYLVGMEVQILHLVSVGLGDGRSSHYYWVRVGFQASHEVPTDTALAGRDNTPHYCSKRGLKWLRQHVCVYLLANSSTSNSTPSSPRKVACLQAQTNDLFLGTSRSNCPGILQAYSEHCETCQGQVRDCMFIPPPWKEKAKDVEHRRALLTGDQCHYWQFESAEEFWPVI